eukprot:TRINITY_DN4189_c0_g1_i1.p1 TRINITY_DN4189_c0_g1~~TRINITY_DN4189_c0_g1_i1.p1  ORF type:complete len:601 (-),score=134.59 TRINITY_DN4189_c0_g1_i1:15-1817(-)
MNTMKSIIIIIGLIYAASATIPNAYIQDITKAKVTGATIYNSYAELQIEVPLKISRSQRTEVLLTNLPSHTIFDGTFRVSAARSEVTSFALGHRMIPSGTVNKTRLLEYEDELKKLETEYSVTRTIIGNLEERQSTLKLLMQPRGDKALNVAEIDAMVELIATKGAAIAKELAELKRKEAQLQKSKETLEQLIKEEKNKGNDVEDYVVSIILTNSLESLDPIEETLTIKYLVNSAQWSPSYNIYYKPEDGTAQLEYYADILQFTGFDFDDVPITLATARFMDVGKIPELASVQIEIAPKGFVSSSQNIQEVYTKSNKAKYSYNTRQNIMPQASQRMAWAADDQMNVEMGGALEFDAMHMREEIAGAIVEDKFVAATFQLGQQLFVPSNRQVPSKVLIARIPLKLNVRHYAVPKLSMHAYLRGFTMNPSKLVLLKGTLSVYINNSYVTKTVLAKDVQPESKFSVLLGIDESIEIQYKPENKFKETEGFIQSYTVQHAYLTISATNNKQEDVTIWIYDQLPKSTDEKIVVSLIEPSPEKATKITSTDDIDSSNETAAFTVNSVTQTVRWIETVKPGQTKQLPFHFKVTYPEKERIIVQDKNK